jgi:hypothetical protein
VSDCRSLAPAESAAEAKTSGASFLLAGSSEKAIMTMWAEQLPVTTTALILKIVTALLITFAAMLVLVHAGIYFSHPLTMQHCLSELF